MSLMKVLHQIYTHAIKTISSKTCAKSTLCQRKLYDVYKRNLKMAQKNVHRPNAIKSTLHIRFVLKYRTNSGQVKVNQPKLG